MTYTVPNTFAQDGGHRVPASQLDANFSAIVAALNEIAPTTNRIPVSAFGAYGTADDTLTWEAALASGEALWVPAGVTSKVSTLALPNTCNILGSRGQSILQSLPDGLPLLTLSGLYNTFVNVQDVILNGDSAHQPSGSNRNGVYFVNAYAGVDDDAYRANSPINMQLPMHFLRVIINDFADDGAYFEGAGANEYWLQVYQCKGVGVHVNSYDNRFPSPDIGANYLENWFFDVNGSSNMVTGGKTWYSGQGGVSGRTAGIRVFGAENVIITGHQIQDSAGSSLLLQAGATGQNQCTFVGQIQYQGVPNYFDPATTSAIDLQGSSGNQIVAQVSLNKSSQIPTYILQNIANGMVPVGTSNNVQVLPMGFLVSDAELNFFNGTLDGNLIDIVPFRRASNWMAGDDGDITFGAEMNGSLVGMIARGQNSGIAPGQLAMIAQGAGSSISGFVNTAAAATGVLTASANFAATETFDIEGVIYTFASSIPPLSAPNLVLVGANLAASLNNATYAVNRQGGTPGVNYSLATVPNENVTAANNGSTTMTITARATGTGGNAITTTETCANAAWGGGTMSGGSNGTQTYNLTFEWTTTGASQRPYLQASTSYANDAAAQAGGVPVAGEYRNGSVDQIRIS